MQNKNPYGELNIDSSNYTKIVPNPQFESVSYAQYAQQYQIQQQPIMGKAKINLVPQTCLVPPQIEVISNTEESNLLKHQNISQKKLFVIKVAFIGLIQEIMMFLASTNSHNNNTLIRIFFDNNIVQWPFYLVILATITAIISSRFLEPTKDHFLQGVIQVCMSVLYIFEASAISIVLGDSYRWYCIMLFCHGLVLVSIIISHAIKCRDDKFFQKYIIVQTVFVTLFIIGFAFLVGLIFAIQIKELFIFSFIIWLMILGYSLIFGLLLLYSIEQLQNGKCQLEKSDFAAAATIAYGNMATPLC